MRLQSSHLFSIFGSALPLGHVEEHGMRMKLGRCIPLRKAMDSEGRQHAKSNHRYTDFYTDFNFCPLDTLKRSGSGELAGKMNEY
jgi:hypothetical protein